MFSKHIVFRGYPLKLIIMSTPPFNIVGVYVDKLTSPMSTLSSLSTPIVKDDRVDRVDIYHVNFKTRVSRGLMGKGVKSPLLGGGIL